MVKVNQKVKIILDDDTLFDYVTETWPADKYHSAGFRVGITDKSGKYTCPEYKEEYLGKYIFPVNK